MGLHIEQAAPAGGDPIKIFVDVDYIVAADPPQILRVIEQGMERGIEQGSRELFCKN